MDIPSTISHAHLPPHGRISCRRCFTGPDDVQTFGRWQVVNDPGAWGSANPKVLVLGFSKGFTQATVSRTGRFEDVPFKGMRPRLTETLHLVGVLGPTETVEKRMVATETDLAFGSLVRCSLSRLNDKTGRLECTGSIMPKAFTEDVAPLVRRCAETFLLGLPASIRLVLMLGTGDTYIAGCRQLIRSLYGSQFADINAVSYQTGDVTWVHVSHPSGLNGHHAAWIAGRPDEKQGHKRLLAMEAVERCRKSTLMPIRTGPPQDASCTWDPFRSLTEDATPDLSSSR